MVILLSQPPALVLQVCAAMSGMPGSLNGALQRTGLRAGEEIHTADCLPHTPQLASELKGTISTRLRSARNSISVPIASTSDKVLASCELALGVAKETVEYAANTRVGRLASGGADLALGGIEKVVEFLLPPAKEESGNCPSDWLATTQNLRISGGPQVLSTLLWNRECPLGISRGARSFAPFILDVRGRGSWHWLSPVGSWLK